MTLEETRILGKINILHVDDDPHQLRFFKLFLEENYDRYSVESLSNPLNVFSKLEEKTYDCVVTDYLMPQMDGISLAMKIRETSEIPIILYMGSGFEDVAYMALSVGVDECVRKSLDPGHYDLLAKKIIQVVERPCVRAQDLNASQGGTIRVLHVDDEETQLVFTKQFLEEVDLRFRIESVSSGKEALDRLYDHRFDCIVSDFMMPGIDGIEFAKKVRESSDIPFIIYTGHGSEEVAEAAFKVGVNDYVRKELNPSHYQVLAQRIRIAVEKHRVAEELKKSEEKYRSLAENSNQAILIYQEGSYKYANPRATEISGYNEQELLSMNPLDLVHPEDLEFVTEISYEYVSKRLNGEAHPDFHSFRFITQDGRTRWVELNSVPIIWDGKSAALNFFTDITELKQYEKRVRGSIRAH